MPIEGPLRELGIHDVFQLLDLSRKTGMLRVSSELRDDEGVVLFDNGRVVQATIRSRPQADDTGGFSDRELERRRRLQIQQAVFELMSWSEGFFSFEDRPQREMAVHARVSVSTESLLMEGARRIDEWSRIAEIIPNVDVIAELAPVEAGRDGAMLDLLPHEWQVLTMIDGVRDLRGIAAALPRDEFDVARIAYGLATTGVITVRRPSRGAVETHRSAVESLLVSARALTRAGRHADAFEELRRAVQEDPLTPRVHFDFGCAAARIGDFALASASWEHVLRLTPDDSVGARARAALDALNHLYCALEAHVDD
jgi:tetratricopeptide (TPR) repeat protein